MAGPVTITGGTITTIGTVTRIASLDSIGEIKKIPEIEIKSVECPKVNDKGLIQAATFKSLAAAAVAAATTKINYDIARDRERIAKIYLDIARDRWQVFKDLYRPVEERQLILLTAQPEFVEEYLKDRNGHTSGVTGAFSRADRHALSLAKEYCLTLPEVLAQDLSLQQSYATGNQANFARKYSQDWTLRLNDTRFNRRLLAANRGRNILSQSLKFASSANAAYGELSSAVSGVAEGAARYLGYTNAQREPQFPQAPRSLREGEVASSGTLNTNRSFADLNFDGGSNFEEMVSGLALPTLSDFGTARMPVRDDILGNDSFSTAYGMTYADSRG